MLIGHSMDIVSVPKVVILNSPKYKVLQAVDTISVILEHNTIITIIIIIIIIIQFFREWAWLHNGFRFQENGGDYDFSNKLR